MWIFSYLATLWSSRREQDLFDPRLSCDSILVVGWTGCRRCSLFFPTFFWVIFSAQYLAPVDLIAVLYIGRFAILSWPTMYAGSKTLALLVTSTILLQNVLYSGLTIFMLKNVIHAKSEIASVVVDDRSGVGDTLRLYFPFASRYVISQFSSLSQLPGCRGKGDCRK